jgi:hypothetical protein
MAFYLGCLGFSPRVFKLFHKLLRFFHRLLRLFPKVLMLFPRLLRLFLKIPNVSDGFDVSWVVIVVGFLSTIYTQYHVPE